MYAIASPFVQNPSNVRSLQIGESSKLTSQMTGAISWRRGDVKYKKNEAFVDVVENVNLLMSAKGTLFLGSHYLNLIVLATGTVLRADVDGQILMRAYLSGTPECKFGLNDKLVLDKAERAADNAVRLDDCQFHQCVELGAFSSDRTISFIPPDGEFELMKCVPFFASTLPFLRLFSLHTPN